MARHRAEERGLDGRGRQMTGIWSVGKPRRALPALASHCCKQRGPSAGTDASTDDAPEEGTGGSSTLSDELILGLHAASGIRRLHSKGRRRTPSPEPATDENEDWLIDILGAYDGTLDGDAATGHHRDAAHRGERRFRASKLRSRAPLSGLRRAELAHHLLAGGRRHRLSRRWPQRRRGRRHGLWRSGRHRRPRHGVTRRMAAFFATLPRASRPCRFRSPAPRSRSKPTKTASYAVMEYFEAYHIAAGTFDAGDTASVKAKVHLEFTALR